MSQFKFKPVPPPPPSPMGLNRTDSFIEVRHVNIRFDEDNKRLMQAMAALIFQVAREVSDIAGADFSPEIAQLNDAMRRVDTKDQR